MEPAGAASQLPRPKHSVRTENCSSTRFVAWLSVTNDRFGPPGLRVLGAKSGRGRRRVQNRKGQLTTILRNLLDNDTFEGGRHER